MVHTKIFLLRVTLYDGCHEHPEYAMVRAKDLKSAQEQGQQEMHDVGEADNGKYWNYGDGDTATRLEAVKAISKTDAQVLRRLNIVHFL